MRKYSVRSSSTILKGCHTKTVIITNETLFLFHCCFVCQSINFLCHSIKHIWFDSVDIKIIIKIIVCLPVCLFATARGKLFCDYIRVEGYIPPRTKILKCLVIIEMITSWLRCRVKWMKFHWLRKTCERILLKSRIVDAVKRGNIPLVEIPYVISA